VGGGGEVERGLMLHQLINLHTKAMNSFLITQIGPTMADDRCGLGRCALLSHTVESPDI
jgi:hypothetical protein